MNSVLEVLFLRRPSIDYISCPVCEFDFSSSGGPVIVLDPLGRLLAPSGFVLGGRGRFRLSWNHYPGALCYTVYKAVDPENPFGEYVVVAECIEDPEIDLEPEGPGCYRVSAITENGETELSDPICSVGDCPFIISGATPSAQTVNQGDPISISCEVYLPSAVQSYLWFKDGILFEDTTGTTENQLSISSAESLNQGSYTLVVEGNGCSDESSPAEVTVTEGPPCSHHIEVVGFLGPVVELGADGTLIGTNDLGTRPNYHRNGVTSDTRSARDSSPTTASQTGTTVTASADFFEASDVGKFIEFATSQTAEIVAFVTPQVVTVSPSQSVGSTTLIVHGLTLGGVQGQGQVINNDQILGGIEQVFGSSDFHAFWINQNTNQIRDLGVDLTPAAMADEGYMILNETLGNVSYLYNPNTQTLTNLGELLPGNGTEALGLNNAQQVAGESQFQLVPASIIHAVKWSGGVLTDIHPAAAGTENSVAFGINDAGHVLGRYRDPVSSDMKGFINTGGASISLGDFGGEVTPIAMNASTVVVGEAETGAGTGIFKPFIWESGVISFLPLLGGTTTGSAAGINSAGWIIGNNDGIPVIWRGGVVEELFTLIPGGTLWTQFFFVDFISDNGWISGLGLYDGGLERYLMQLCS